MIKIASAEQLRLWLHDKDPDWGRVIAVRAAMRVLPTALNNCSGFRKPEKFVLALFRASFLSWASIAFNAPHMWPSVDRSSKSLTFVIDSERHQQNNLRDLADKKLHLATYAGQSVSRAARAAASTIDVDMLAADSASDAVRAFLDSSAFWNQVSADCDWLKNLVDSQQAVSQLIWKSLWLNDNVSPDSIFVEVRDTFSAIRFDNWTYWLKQRLDGGRDCFNIPHDSNWLETTQVVNTIAGQMNKGFWEKGARYVNSMLQIWIDEANDRLSSLRVPPIPVQNPNAIAFCSNADGKIAIDTSIPIDSLRTDPDARDRHAELKREASSLLARCSGSNAGARLTRLLENYAEALGDSIEFQRPSLLVQRGNRLGSELKAYGDPATLLSPVADDLLLDLEGLVSAHNMHVMSEPILRDRATAMLGPDTKPVLISPDEIKALAQEADRDGILAAGVREIVEEAAEIAPTTPDLESRLTIWSTETVKNLVIEAFSMVRRNKIATIVVTGAIVASPPAVSVGALYLTANFLMKRREWVESRLGNSPTWKALFIDLCSWWEENRPPHSTDQ